MILSHLVMSRMLLLSTSCVLVLLMLCLSQECLCSARHLSSSFDDHAMDGKAKPLSHSTIKDFGNNIPFKMTANGKVQVNTIHDDEHDQKQTDGGLKNKKDMIQDQKVKRTKEVDPKSSTFRVPLKHRKIDDQQPGFNLDYSPPKTHPPSHN